MVFQPRKSVLLTGAGFSKDFGGYLGTEMWSVIFSQPEIQKHPRLREYLLNELNYEVAYNHVLYTGSFEKTIQDDFTKAIEQSYQQMREAFWGPTVRKEATGACRAIVRPFAGTGHDDRGFVFTLNQDLFLERFFSTAIHLLI